MQFQGTQSQWQQMSRYVNLEAMKMHQWTSSTHAVTSVSLTHNTVATCTLLSCLFRVRAIRSWQTHKSHQLSSTMVWLHSTSVNVFLWGVVCMIQIITIMSGINIDSCRIAKITVTCIQHTYMYNCIYMLTSRLYTCVTVCTDLHNVIGEPVHCSLSALVGMCWKLAH